MTDKIDFYHIKKNTDEAYLYLARLVEKVHSKGHEIFICTVDQVQAACLDQLLWTYKDTSFLPHHIIENNNEHAPILISDRTIPKKKDVLINLSATIPSFLDEFSRILEFVFEQNATECRQKYREYQKLGYKINVISPN